ncbi:MAG: isocitrate/isopropylmalate family dehydrogenase [Candidatus Euphemobacter frigidus]|nr:isocitrate/isopropylmalate family dehydrogenase [Candidatus Euphemobacter frigidus]MDP8276358.1 isocitrate/isopropylmalate family dehydrogenase [Candidatus Euphemobacter frigidus]
MKIDRAAVKEARKRFERILEAQLGRVERLKEAPEWIDYRGLRPLRIGIIGGDGIGPVITREAQRVLETILKPELEKGAVRFRFIEGLTIENRAAVHQAIPDQVREEIKRCPVLLKGPTTTPRKGDPEPNIESANVALRKELDLFANVRPVRVPELGIDWTFFRENTEGAYMLGSDGFLVTDDLALDFKVITGPGSERIIRLAFEYARKNRRQRITAVSKANVIKTTDGLFLDTFFRIAAEYPEIEADDWYIDIMTAKLLDPNRRAGFQVFVLPNLYGDILTDEAAQIQGGVGTAGSANIGRRSAMFEAIHGSAPRMVKEGRERFADPFSMIRAAAMLLAQIGYPDRAKKLEMALDICGQYEKRLTVTGRPGGATTREITDYLLETLIDSELEEKWRRW